MKTPEPANKNLRPACKDFGLGNATFNNIAFPTHSNAELIEVIRKMHDVMPVLEWQLLDDATQEKIMQILGETKK